jgi:hypothetical protein
VYFHKNHVSIHDRVHELYDSLVEDVHRQVKADLARVCGAMNVSSRTQSHVDNMLDAIKEDAVQLTTLKKIMSDARGLLESWRTSRTDDQLSKGKRPQDSLADHEELVTVQSECVPKAARLRRTQLQLTIDMFELCRTFQHALDNLVDHFDHAVDKMVHEVVTVDVN